MKDFESRWGAFKGWSNERRIKLLKLEEDLGALSIELSDDELREFQRALSRIALQGSREPESIHTSL